MKGFLAGFIAVITVIAALVPLMQMPDSPKSTSGCSSAHASILISSNSQFTPANGVTGGTGTYADPYVISGWDINASGATGISIRGTDAHFDIRNVCVHWGGTGISLDHVKNGRVENSSILNNVYGIYLGHSTDSFILANNFSSSLYYALDVADSSDVTISFNSVSLSQHKGIYVESTENVVISSNDIFSNEVHGFWVSDSANVSISLNSVHSNRAYGIYVDFSKNVSIFSNDVFSNDAWSIYTSSNKGISISRNRIHSNVGHGISAFHDAALSILNNNIFSNSQEGIVAYFTDRAFIAFNSVHSNGYPDGHEGIELRYSTNALITANDILLNGADGINIQGSANTTVTSNNVTFNNQLGYSYWSGAVFFYDSTNATASGNNISSNGAQGIRLLYSDFTFISDNTIMSNEMDGITLYESTRTAIFSNIISSTRDYGIYLLRSTGNSIYHNYIINNTRQASDDLGSENAWDDGYPSGGNYWSDYKGTDYFSGPDQDIPFSDGIGDTPYVIDSNSRDRYPFMGGSSTNHPPIADAGEPYTGCEGSVLAFDASASFDPDGDALQFRWDFDNDGLADTSWSSSPAVNHTWSDDYVSVVRVEVSDGKATSNATAMVEILNVPPSIRPFGPFTVAEGSSLSVMASATDQGSDDLTFTWTFEYGPTVQHVHFNDGIGPDPCPSPWGTYPFSVNDMASNTYGDNGMFRISLKVTDDDGGMATYETNVTVFNVLPSGSASITSAQHEGNTIQFSAHVTDPGSDDLFLTWDWEDGTPDSTSTYYNDGVSPDPYPSPDIHPREITDVKSHTYGDNGAFTVTAFIWDDDGGSSGTTFTITATPDNLPPSVSVSGGMSIDEGQSVSLTASAKDPGSDDLTFAWSWGEGSSESRVYYNNGASPDPPNSPGGTFPFTATDTAVHPYGDNGLYSINLKVTDDDGGSTTWSGQLTVNNLPPVIKPLGPFTLDEGSPLSIPATATDPGSDDLAFKWSFELGPTTSNIYYNNGVGPDPYPSPGPVFPFTATDNAAVTYGDNGVYNLTLTVTDDDGGSASYTTQVTVNNLPPVIKPFGLFTVDEGSPLLLCTNATDPGSDDLTFKWIFELEPTTQDIHYNDGIGPDPSKSPWGTFPFTAQDTAANTYGDNGVFDVTLTATDDDGGSASYTTTITVLNLPPAPSIDGAFQPLTRHLPPNQFYPLDPITFNGSATDPGSDDLTFTWDFGDGTVVSSPTHYNDGVSPDPYPSPGPVFPFSANESVDHTYSLPGDYNVTLTVKDDDGGVSSTQMRIHITSPLDLKNEAIQRIKALKELALARGDEHFLHELDKAERHVWKSLGYKHPFKPDSVSVDLAPDMSVKKEGHDEVELVLGPSWDARLPTYTHLTLTWENGVVTVIDLPKGWPTKDLHAREEVWVDAWQQDVDMHTKWDKKAGTMTLTVQVHDASMGFTISLDSYRVASLSFAYEIRPWWIDDSHLDPKQGKHVFDEEEKAVKHLVDREKDHGNVTIECKLKEKMWTPAERAALGEECDLVANVLVKADEILARITLNDAIHTPIMNPKHTKDVQHEIDEEQEDLAKAYEEWDELKYDHAIDHFGKAWEHAQHAIEHAMKK